MDLLIELIVWVFKSLFGDPEAPADVQRRGGAGPRTPNKRGPYNYGDNQGGGPRPKTLEEILEEVRREAAAKRGGVQPQQQAPQPRPEPPVPKQTVAERTFKSSLETLPEQSPPPAPVVRPQEAVKPIEAPETVKRLEKISQRYEKPDAPPPTPRAEPVKESKAARKARKAAAAAAVQAAPVDAGSPVALIRQIREASPEGKLLAARQAIIISEVFGPPRSRRPYAAGRRLI